MVKTQIKKVKEIKDEQELKNYLGLMFEVDPRCLQYGYSPNYNKFVSKVTKIRVSSTIDLKKFVEKFFTNYDEVGGSSASIEEYKYELIDGFYVIFTINYVDREIKVYIEKKC